MSREGRSPEPAAPAGRGRGDAPLRGQGGETARPVSTEDPLTRLPGVGPARARALAAAGFHRVGDLLHHVPIRYEDRSTITPVVAAVAGAAATFRGRLVEVRRIRGRRRGMSLVRGILEDGSGRLPVLWFNRPWLAASVAAETDYVLHGAVREARRGKGVELLNPSCERADEAAVHGGRIVPVYGGAGEMGPAGLRRILAWVLAALDPRAAVAEPLPSELLARHRLPALGPALAALHFPGAAGEEPDLALLAARRSPAHLRLIYGELLELQVALSLRRARQVLAPQPFRCAVDERVRSRAREALPFQLTGAQRRVLREIVDDMTRPAPMLRLLQGDVGSGKTIVAALALVVAMENRLQGAFMAPTELLAEQHFRTLRRLLGGRYRVGLLTASAPDLEADRRRLAAGELDLAVGTHALIQQGVAFHRLGLVVIDEQHRFGVAQRQVLQAKGERPDVLVMTATPIPRSLALTAYGDLELSVLDELPPGRQPVATEVRPAGRREAFYRGLRAELEATGGRAYVVFPLIEESEAVAAASVAAAGEEVRRWLAPLPSAVLHGRVSADERERAVAAFSSGAVRVLVATTVIEVGVDVPEATVMVIESGERFGLAQLHQLRGRVGRGAGASRCVLLHGPRLSEPGRRRLEVFAETTDGFRIAEADLAIRGPGDLLGTRQSGLPTLRVANLVEDLEWLEKARRDARELLGRWGEPELAELRRRVEAAMVEGGGGSGGA
ncbi:MAG TPA: ATP-dependent DNA helicase RecG [Thermoanaerobaculia bacterium]|nr:ATP-dependent DNA helicase RecG [Thermoanaerobaculia bacterium]